MFAGCAVDDGAPDKPNATVHMTVDVTRGDGTTRSILKENGGDLSCDWQTTDVLVVTDAQGNELGTLNVKEIGTDASKATFAGDIDGVADGSNVTFNYIYLGNKGKTDVTDANATYTVDYAGQNGTLASLSDRDVMTASATGSVKDGVAIVPGVELVRKVSFAKFALSLKGDGAISNGATVSISGTGLKTSLALDKKNAEATVSADDGTITLANVNPSKLYVTLLPSADIKELNFTVTSGESTYSGKYTVTKGIAAGKYYRKENGDGTYGPISIEVAPAQDPVDEDVVGPVFEVNGKKFRFTRANLQYNTKTSTYFIPEKQTDYICKSGRRIGTNTPPNDNPEIIGLFRWGCTGVDDNVLLPWSPDFWHEKVWYEANSTISDQLPSQNLSVNRTISTNTTYCPDSQAQDTSYDWGNAYTSQRKQSTNDNVHYFTLTSAELSYVINTFFAACCTVDGVNGAIILPYTDFDSAKDAIDKVGGKANKLYKLSDHYTDRTKFGYDRLTLTYDQLTSLNGVFFPASGMNNPSTGSRNQMVSSDYPGNCYYWTSTPSTTPNAICWYVNGGKTEGSREFHVYGNGKCFAYSVRLVKEVEN